MVLPGNFHNYLATKMGKSERIYGRPSEQPLPNISVGQHLLNKLREFDNYPVFTEATTGNAITNKEILAKSVKLACFLEKYLKMGERVSIISENRLNWFIPVCASLFIGTITTPYNPAYTEWEFRNMLDISKPRVIFVSRNTERLLAKIVSRLPWQVELIELDDEPFETNIRTLKDILDMEKDIDISKYQARDVGDTAKHPAAILCSSGTTGVPKGVTLSHKNLLAMITKTENVQNISFDNKGSRSISFLPFFHGYAFGMFLLTIQRKSKVILMSSFDPELFLKSIEKYKITHLPVVPPIMTFLAKHPLVERYDFSSVKEILCGAAPFPKELAEEVKCRLGVKYICNAYGMTEVSMVSNMGAYEDNDETLRYLLPGIFCKIIDTVTGKTLDQGEVGEICFKGEHVMMGYWNNPEVTKQTIDKNGWLHTGDVGYMDEQERLHIVDRLKELIKYKAYQVSPTEIETILLSHPGVKDAAVTGKPDHANGEIPIAFVVKQPNAKLTAQEMTELVKEKLSPQKWLRGGVHFVDAIPKTPSGKIIRRELQTLTSKL